MSDHTEIEPQDIPAECLGCGERAEGQADGYCELCREEEPMTLPPCQRCKEPNAEERCPHCQTVLCEGCDADTIHTVKGVGFVCDACYMDRYYDGASATYHWTDEWPKGTPLSDIFADNE